jgi:hypothetical protein
MVAGHGIKIHFKTAERMQSKINILVEIDTT